METIERPGFSIQRIGARLLASAQDPNWTVPNVAFRLHLRHCGEDISRIYTVRDSDGAGRFCFDVVVHEGASPMMQWVQGVKVGDSFDLTGPRPHMGLPEAKGRKLALFLDETAIPALYSLLRRWPGDVSGAGWWSSIERLNNLASRRRLTFSELVSVSSEAEACIAILLYKC
ncbi:siderophore-interacting protein [Sphingobium yanoikuyae]|uniref:siderophore-interacting protein n=1 Tax=Sphingobium yanoikuyae TaxID=13690 RepID=UPI0028AA81FB|nr:siderophore-interacting protein [Sphingobium yanoikuyae]